MNDDVKVQKPIKSEPNKGAERVRIILDNGDHVPKNGLMVGHNGTMYKIMPGVPVDIPVHVLDVLNDAVGDYPIVEGETGQITGYQPRSKYPYRVVVDRNARG